MNLKKNISFKIACINCHELIDISFDEDGDVIGNVIQCGFVQSQIFDDKCTPLGLNPENNGGFRHFIC